MPDETPKRKEEVIAEAIASLKLQDRDVKLFYDAHQYPEGLSMGIENNIKSTGPLGRFFEVAFADSRSANEFMKMCGLTNDDLTMPKLPIKGKEPQATAYVVTVPADNKIFLGANAPVRSQYSRWQ